VETSAELMLRARWVAPMDQPVIEDGGIVLSGGTIKAVGDASTLRRQHPAALEHDLGASVLLPGLINAHVHLELSEVPRLGGERWNGPLADWLIEIIKRSLQGDDAGRVARAIETGVRQCLRFGVTTVGDITRQPAMTRPLLRKTRLRVVSFGEIQAMATRRGFLDARLSAAADRTHEGGSHRVGLSPHAPYSVEAAGYQRCVELSRSGAYPISTHLAESADEAEFLARHSGPLLRIWDFLGAWDDGVPRFGGGPIRFANSVGLLDLPAVFAHVNYCDDEELRLLAGGGRASVVYCPRTHAYFGHPPHRWREMIAAGVNVAVGTDSTASSPDLNLVDDLRLVRRLTPDVPASELWQLVTTRAAAALGLDDEVGSLTPGKQADLVCFPTGDTRDPLEHVLRESILPSNLWIAGEPVADALR
jgi:cytosine/adenosine deaminase-related metal-dependent hydrolase